MLVVAERLNATRKPVAEALRKRDKVFIRDEVRRQVEAGADFIDVNTALSPKEERDLMIWAVETIREATDTPLAIDTANPEAARAGLERVPKGSALLNSISGETERLERMLPFVSEFGTKVVALAMDDAGMPNSNEDRWRALERIFQATDAAGVPRENIFVDPLVRPLATNPEQVVQVLDMIREIQAKGGGAGTIVGLSNISFGLPARHLLNRTFLAMAAGAGLTAAILDPLEPGMAAAVLAANALRGDDPYCMNYIGAYREGRL